MTNNPCSENSDSCGMCGYIHHPKQCSTYDEICYKCGRKGHYGKLCKSKSRCHTSSSRHMTPDFNRPHNRGSWGGHRCHKSGPDQVQYPKFPLHQRWPPKNLLSQYAAEGGPVQHHSVLGPVGWWWLSGHKVQLKLHMPQILPSYSTTYLTSMTPCGT